jgi:hypothetical protein
MRALLTQILAGAGQGEAATDDRVALIRDPSDPFLRDVRTIALSDLAAALGVTTNGADAVTRNPVRLPANGIHGLLQTGQSNVAGAQGRPLLSTTALYGSLMFNGGLKAADAPGTASFVPAVEDLLAEQGADYGGNNRGETGLVQAMAQAVRTAARVAGVAPADYLIWSATSAEGGTSIAEHAEGGAIFEDGIYRVTRAKARANTLGVPFAVPMVVWLQGEADAGRTPSTDRTVYKDTLIEIAEAYDARIRAITGQANPVKMLVHQTASVSAVNSDIVLAQADAAAESDLIILGNPIYHLPHNADALHLSALGHALRGAATGRAYSQLVVDGRAPDVVQPLYAWAEGTTIRVRFQAASRLVIDRTGLPAATDNGLRVLDSGGTVTLTGQTIEGGNTWRATMSRALTGTAPRVRIALDYTGGGSAGGGICNIRDSATDTVTLGGVTYPLWNVSTAAELAVAVL